jgi:chemotaxis protein histidine kinase CheA
MAADAFTERLARVRARFISALESKIEDTYTALPQLSAADATAAFTAVEESYRRVHGIVGVGPTVGFPLTGHAARVAENVLLRPRQAERGLTLEEMTSFRKALHALREAAARELQSFYAGCRG